MSESTPLTTILILLIFLLVLMILLFILYKKLNKEADGKYTVRNIVYKEGGIRDRMRGAALAVGTHLGVQLWPDGKTEEDGEEMQEIQVDGRVENGGQQGSDSEGDNQEEGDDSTNQGDEAKEKGDDTSNDDDNDDDDDDNVIVSESPKQEEERELLDQQESKGGTEEEKVEKVGEGESEGEASGGAGLLIDLKQFSGSAIWSEEGAGQCGDVTAL